MATGGDERPPAVALPPLGHTRQRFLEVEVLDATAKTSGNEHLLVYSGPSSSGVFADGASLERWASTKAKGDDVAVKSCVSPFFFRILKA